MTIFFVFQMCSVTHYSVTIVSQHVINMSQSVTYVSHWIKTNSVLGRSLEIFLWEANRNICIVYFLLLVISLTVFVKYGDRVMVEPPLAPLKAKPRFLLRYFQSIVSIHWSFISSIRPLHRRLSLFTISDLTNARHGRRVPTEAHIDLRIRI